MAGVTGLPPHGPDWPLGNTDCRPSYTTAVPLLMDYPELSPWWDWVGLRKLSNRLNTGCYMLSCYLNW